MNAPIAPFDAGSLDLATLDMSRPEWYSNDTWHEAFRRLRAEDPVHYCPASEFGPYWSVTTYDDIMAVELDHETFSNELGGIQVRDPAPGSEAPSFIRMDPPRHTAERKTVAPIVAPFNLKNFTPTIRERTNYVLDQLPVNEDFDWVDHVSIELTTMMLATLFDFPWEDRRKLTFWSDVTIFFDFDAPDALVKSEEERWAELVKMSEYFQHLWNERARAEPTFDLISMLAHGEETKTMSQREFIGNLGLLIVGGNDTTRNSMSGGLYYLNRHPGEWEKLRADPALVPKMVAETIRYQTPVIHMRRTARRDVEFRGRQIKAGDKVVMWYVSGNRDDTAIPEADRFIVDRARPRQHLSYGAGIHRCVGDRLADLQLQILWEEILRRDLKIEVLDEPTRLNSNFIRGIRKLPVRIVG